jgi:hypothetical protein
METIILIGLIIWGITAAAGVVARVVAHMAAHKDDAPQRRTARRYTPQYRIHPVRRAMRLL